MVEPSAPVDETDDVTLLLEDAALEVDVTVELIVAAVLSLVAACVPDGVPAAEPGPESFDSELQPR